MSNPEKFKFLKESIRNVPDFPKKGIQFKDITTALKIPAVFKSTVNHIAEYYKTKGITKVVAIESRGFIVGGALAAKLEAGFVPVRKKGKLPAETYSRTYSLEYGEDTLEIHKDALEKDDIVLLHDDLLATGGTTVASVDLIKNFQIKNIFINYIVELDFLNGRGLIGNEYDIYSLVHF
ncbi:MAG: adenine phosphoribosyltransferase [Bacteroidales bacterium]|nr:MAG: adenine phosphoribosyltransferase [Bacteroidales bacterium]